MVTNFVSEFLPMNNQLQTQIYPNRAGEMQIPTDPPMQDFKEKQQVYYPIYPSTFQSPVYTSSAYPMILPMLRPNLGNIQGGVNMSFFANKTPIQRVPMLSKPKIKRKSRAPKKNPRSVSCGNCKAEESPLWRKGDGTRVLCNKCGLYWARHGFDRPITLERAKRRSAPDKFFPKRKIGPKESMFDARIDFNQQYLVQKPPATFVESTDNDKTRFMDLIFGKDDTDGENEVPDQGAFITEESTEELIQKRSDYKNPGPTYLDFDERIFFMSNQGVWNSPTKLEPFTIQSQEKTTSDEFELLQRDGMYEGMPLDKMELVNQQTN
jgi:hypothetical protein